MTDALADIPCTQLKGVGPKLSEQLAKSGIESMQDVLFHLPYRYQDRTRITPIGHLKIGDYAVIEANITQVQLKFAPKPSLLLTLEDATGRIRLRFFHFTAAQKNQLIEGVRLRCFGETRPSNQGRVMVHPEYRVVQEGQTLAVEETLTPIYSKIAGLSQGRIRQLIQQALQWLEQADVQDYLPLSLRQELKLGNLADAIRYLHQPPPSVSLERLEQGKHPAQQRLALEELIAHQLCLLNLKQHIITQPAPALPASGKLIQAFCRHLPFELTAAQKKVCQDIENDLAKPIPMMRLVQGDVGSGKTVVAALAALQAIESNKQAALMAPTEILAEQHYKNMQSWFEPLGLKVAWLSGKQKGKARKEMQAMVASGEAQMVVGTHALFQKDIEFSHLGLAIIDEQHRFGVHQRLSLREKGERFGEMPHQLIMTATPIPRTLAMTAYADLDVSVIDELPPGRTPVKTIVLPNSRREDVVARIEEKCQSKGQAYWVCTLIEESETLQCEAAEKTTDYLRELLPNVTVGLVHGRLKPAEKESIMQQFKAGDIDLLVATTVIEVGVDVPNASLMVIENPERLGLAQLHQLRGRVGRGSAESFCVLLYGAPLSNDSRDRLQIMREHSSGFDIAQKDLELRGPGEVLGTRQTGLVLFRMADLLRDAYMLDKAKDCAEQILNHHPGAIMPLVHRWVRDGEKYGKVS